MEPNEENTPVTEEVQEQPAEQAEAPEETTEQEAPQESESQEEEVSEPSQTTQEQPEEEIDWTQYVPNVTAPPPTDEEGNIDPVKWGEQLKAENRFESQEVRAWTKLENQHPEISRDAGLREMILAKRLFDVQRGGKGTLEAAANDVFSRLSGAKNAGKAAQQTSVKVQKSAALQKPSGTQTTSAPDARDRIRQGDQNAIHSQLTSWLNDGKI